MLKHWVFREPSLAFGLPVYIVAAFALPLHLGWTGASWLAFVGYLALVTVLFSIADALLRPAYYRRRISVLPQSLFSFPSLAVPAALAFWLGTLAGPVDEAMDEDICASQGATEVDTAAAESDDTFDVTADCARGSTQTGSR